MATLEQLRSDRADAWCAMNHHRARINDGTDDSPERYRLADEAEHRMRDLDVQIAKLAERKAA